MFISLRNISTVLRIAGYASGLLGLGLFLAGGDEARTAGAVLLLIMFVAFLINYALYIFNLLSRRR